jgi:hypothetical protein
MFCDANNIDDQRAGRELPYMTGSQMVIDGGKTAHGGKAKRILGKTFSLPALVLEPDRHLASRESHLRQRTHPRF